VMVLHHNGDLKVFHRDMVIGLSVLLGDFEMVIVALALDLQMRLGGFAAAITALLAAAHRTLFASERSLRCPIIAWVVYGMPFGVGQEGLQPNVNADIGMLARTWKVFCWWFGLADEKGVPMPISPQDKMHRFGSALDRAMQLDFEEMPDLLGHDEMFLVLMQVHVFAILSQLDRMPAVRVLKARKTYTRDVMLLGSEKALERLSETISQHLHGGGRNMCALSLESNFQVILAWEGAFFLIPCLDRLKHSVIDDASFLQALHEQIGLVLIHEQAILKCSHTSILLKPIRNVKREDYAYGGRVSSPWLKPGALTRRLVETT
jgi:hypothetical protein